MIDFLVYFKLQNINYLSHPQFLGFPHRILWNHQSVIIETLVSFTNIKSHFRFTMTALSLVRINSLRPNNLKICTCHSLEIRVVHGAWNSFCRNFHKFITKSNIFINKLFLTLFSPWRLIWVVLVIVYNSNQFCHFSFNYCHPKNSLLSKIAQYLSRHT